VLQALDVVVVNGAVRLRCGPVDTGAKALVHLSGQVLPAGEAVVTRDDELRVALRQRRVDARQMRSRTREGGGITGGDVAREFLRLLTERLERRTNGERLHGNLLS
jgi:hypothetical protein